MGWGRVSEDWEFYSLKNPPEKIPSIYTLDSNMEIDGSSSAFGSWTNGSEGSVFLVGLVPGPSCQTIFLLPAVAAFCTVFLQVCWKLSHRWGGREIMETHTNRVKERLTFWGSASYEHHVNSLESLTGHVQGWGVL